MTEQDVISEGQPTINIEKFLSHFSLATITQISNTQLPEALKARIKTTNGNIAFLIAYADKTKTFGTTGGFGGKIQLLDVGDTGQYLGEGNIEPDHIEDLGIPIDGFTFTNNRYRRKGFGTRRLMIMNAISWMLFDLPLHSSPYQEKVENRRLWERLVKEGKAEYMSGQKMQRYKFIS